ncbi:MAG: matrixin family metalloprotease [Candidatus Eisenbacteria bacterium]|uniref:Matrixin family metalloprotease n=1 Tax=Eiseniibacteriota bacterium TaxID=2212470 RepID=A0A538SD95_UNCEI|nr:MAG: matrixin family metalloprotease [Candidatus Eisenbacteria bacterium]
MKKMMIRVATLALAVPGTLGVTDALAFRLIQNTGSGRMTSGARVTCDDPAGYVHWNTSSLSWRLNPAGQGGKAGVAAAVQSAMTSWNNVSPAPYTLNYAGTTNAGFVTDGINSVLWGTGNGCSGSCLALTALVLVSGQVITEADISLNDAASWNTGGSDYDVQAVVTHELGHSLGIHHTELQRSRNRPSMYATYFGVAGRSLESDDMDALNCIYGRYPPRSASLIASTAMEPDSRGTQGLGLGLTARPRTGGSVLGFGLSTGGRVKLEVFDVAGRKLATLVDAVETAGNHEIAWDGATTQGRAASGFYFARITTAEGRATATVPLAE